MMKSPPLVKVNQLPEPGSVVLLTASRQRMASGRQKEAGTGKRPKFIKFPKMEATRLGLPR